MITIVFKSGETRVINPTSHFFLTEKGGRHTDQEIIEKIKDMIFDFGGMQNVFTANCTAFGKTIEVVIPKWYNKPIKGKDLAEIRKEKEIRLSEKDLIKTLFRDKHIENPQFTVKMIPASDGTFTVVNIKKLKN